MKDSFYKYICELQDTIAAALELADGVATFKEDLWKRPEGGGGRTRVLEGGAVFEKGGVNISGVHGTLPKSMLAHLNVSEASFYACGLSLVLHPKNPMAPTVHANWRYFEMYDDDGNISDCWFGGGQDLTPYYLFEDDIKHFHTSCKMVCDKHNSDFYIKFKDNCDRYFYNSHRGEARGVGGLFFDYCKENSANSISDWYNFVEEISENFINSYAPIVNNRKLSKYSVSQKEWQEIRRGRYVEFNLVYDRGTLFGLQTGGRVESILMSLPPTVEWNYDWNPTRGSPEAELYDKYLRPQDWT